MASQISAAISGAAEALHFPDAGGRGDVDLRQIVADHVDAGEDQAALFQFRAERRADLSFSRSESVGRFRPAADMHVGARLALAGTRLIAPANSPSTRMMRLSPLRTSGT